jgi:hypothetical protein
VLLKYEGELNSQVAESTACEFAERVAGGWSKELHSHPFCSRGQPCKYYFGKCLDRSISSIYP